LSVLPSISDENGPPRREALMPAKKKVAKKTAAKKTAKKTTKKAKK
jgi:hypothetical protein